MHAILPVSLDTKTLGRRLHELAGDERNVQVDFLLHLGEFDRREGYLDAGYRSLWEYCLSALHLREGAAARRIEAMKVLRRWPALEAPLRDGRLSLTTVRQIGPLLAAENLDDLVARAAFQTRAEVDHLVATLQPRTAPKGGIRKLAAPAAPQNSALAPQGDTGHSPGPLFSTGGGLAGTDLKAANDAERVPMTVPNAPVAPPRAASDIRAVSEDQRSLRVTIDGVLKTDLETLKSLLGHKVRNGDLAEVLREAVRCAIEKHGKRRGAVRPARTRKAKPGGRASFDPRAIPLELRRQVWERDEGRCAIVGEDGHRCGSRERLEIDHVETAEYGGIPRLEDLRLACRPHNFRYAEVVYGRSTWRSSAVPKRVNLLPLAAAHQQ